MYLPVFSVERPEPEDPVLDFDVTSLEELAGELSLNESNAEKVGDYSQARQPDEEHESGGEEVLVITLHNLVHPVAERQFLRFDADGTAESIPYDGELSELEEVFLASLRTITKPISEYRKYKLGLKH